MVKCKLFCKMSNKEIIGCSCSPVAYYSKFHTVKASRIYLSKVQRLSELLSNVYPKIYIKCSFLIFLYLVPGV